MSCIACGSYRRVLLIAALALILAQPLLAAGSGTIRGKVLDRETNEPLPGATVLVRGTNLGAATALDGEYRIAGVPAGSHSLTVSYVGYVSTTIGVVVAENEEVLRDILMEPTAITGKAVVVTAQAQGQLGAINQQLSSNTIENVVSKARIRELPDVNAAESIGRLPGVSIQRSGGEATKVEIRGLNPKYSIITVNGVTLPATSTTDRSVDLSLISSNMLDGIVLKKAVTPDMDADVLGGTVDLKLREAPEGFQVTASGQGGYNELQKYYGNYNFNLTASSRFFENRLGVIAGGNIDNYDRSADKFQDNYQEVSPSGVTQVQTMEMLLREEKVNRKRNGASLLFDYVIPSGKVTGNGFFNRLDWTGRYNINDMWMQGAPYSSNRHFYQLQQRGGRTQIFTSALGVRQDFGWIHYDFSVSRSGTQVSNPDDRVWQWDQEAGAFTGAVNPYTPPTSIPGMATIDTNKTWLANVYSYSTRLNDNQTSAQLNIQVPFRIGDQVSGFVKTGGKFRWIDRRNNEDQYGQNGIQYGNTNGPNPTLSLLGDAYPDWNVDTLVGLYGGLPIRGFLTNYTRSNFLHGDYPLGFVLDQSKMNKITDFIKTTNQWRMYSIGSLGNDYDGIERLSAGYLMGEVNIGRSITLIPGVRYEEEYTRYHGERYRQVTPNNQEAPPADLLYLTTERRNSYLLPMVNLIVKPASWLQVKLSRTETLARPDYIQYAPITSITSDQSAITAANSDLTPSRARNYDAAVSVYSNSVGLLAVDGFYKEIDNLVFYTSFYLSPGITPIPGLNIPENWYQGASPRVNTYINNPYPATYYGVELEWQTNFWYLPGILHGLVLDINYTRIFSKMKLGWYYDSVTVVGRPPYIRQVHLLVDSTTSTRMPDQPAHIFNFTLGYDLGGFSARLSYLYQTDKLTSIGYAGVYPSPILSSYSGSYGRWDLTLQQKFGQHVQVFANLNNLNNRPDRNFTGSALTAPSYIEYYGFTMDLGIRYSL